MEPKHHIARSARVTQSGDKTLNNSIHRKWFALALGGFLFTSLFAVSAPLVEAGCQQWDVSGAWMITQGSYVIHANLSQNGKTISGTAKQAWVSDHQVKELNGQVAGTITGATFYVQINWSGGGAGVYSGEIATGGGGLAGTTYDKNNPQSTAAWSTDHHFNCADAAALIPPRKVIKPGLPKATATAPVVTYDANDPNRPHGFINGLQLPTPTPTPTPSAEADESSSSVAQEQPKKKKKKKHHHHDDDEN